MKLTPAQRKAIEHTGQDLQLIACAGSGKTEVVARRVVRLLTPGRKDSLQPRNIVAFTFTEKAAAELKERVYKRTREELGDVTGLAEMFIGTIHAFCLELLKSEVPKYLKYEVLNEVQQGLFVDRNSRKSGLTECTDLQGRPLARFKDTFNYISALAILREADYDDKKLEDCSIPDGLESYQSLLDQHTYLDYSSILQEAVSALTSGDKVRSHCKERIKYVIVDEYQDVNPVQEAVVWSLHELGARICVVGDDDQTIYQWRGSDVHNILTFDKRYKHVDRITIADNFRSTEGVVETAREFIEQNVDRLPKKMQPTDGHRYEPGDIVALSFGSAEEEAAYIASTAKALRGVAFTENDTSRGLAWSDMAVLLRSVKGNAAPITKAFRDAGVPYVVTGMANLFDTPEAEAARQLFYFMADRPDVTPTTLKRAWDDADLGLDPAELSRALKKVAASKVALTDTDQKRWGLYTVQRVFLDFIEAAGLREERVPGDRGEIVFYNLGKFSQLISDFEQIHFHSKPVDKYASFANFLQYRAEGAYPEGWQDNQYANPNAVRVMTIHQAKGMQWPVVFVPALLKNRFPAKKSGGRNVWHLLPKEAIDGQARYEGTIEDERRLFYVAMTRSQKFLHLTWAPVAGNQLFQRKSVFWDDVLRSKYVKRRAADYSKRKKLKPQPLAGVANVVFSFSDLKYFFECPYQFKLRVLYGFNAPIQEALGYGKSLHDALAEVHMRAIDKDFAADADVPDLVARHLHVPYAYPALRETLEQAAEQVLHNYLHDNAERLKTIEYSEKPVEVNLGDGVSIVGRIDLVRRKDTGEVTIVDLKSNKRTQPEEVTEDQLHTYALGYRELTGRDADYVEIYPLEERKPVPRSVDNDIIDDVTKKTREAADALRKGTLVARPAHSAETCRKCDFLRMCSQGRAIVAEDDKRKKKHG